MKVFQTDKMTDNYLDNGIDIFSYQGSTCKNLSILTAFMETYILSTNSNSRSGGKSINDTEKKEGIK